MALGFEVTRIWIQRATYSLALGACQLLSGCAPADNELSGRSALQASAVSVSPVSDFAAGAAVAGYVDFSAPGSTAYRIGPLDVVDVSVFKVPELSKTIQVSDTGSLNFPLVGNVPAAGKTSAEVERELVRRLDAGYVKSPQVTVFVRDYNSQRFTVEGAVKKPGVYPVRGDTLLLDAVATAGGLDEFASSSDVIILRRKGDQKLAARYNLDEIRSGHSSNPGLQMGDVVIVAESAAKRQFQNIIKALPAVGAFRLFM